MEVSQSTNVFLSSEEFFSVLLKVYLVIRTLHCYFKPLRSSRGKFEQTKDIPREELRRLGGGGECGDPAERGRPVLPPHC